MTPFQIMQSVTYPSICLRKSKNSLLIISSVMDGDLYSLVLECVLGEVCLIWAFWESGIWMEVEGNVTL